MNNITHSHDYYSLKIYINGLLHIQLNTENHDGLQSWYDTMGKQRSYFIEFYRKIGDPIRVGYDNEDTWKAVLKILDEST